MKWDWNELFGNDYYIELKNNERYYFGLDEISSDWEKSEFLSKTNSCYKRTTVFWDNCTIKKVIVEENRRLENGKVVARYYQEFDTCIKTENRLMILPLTSKGKKKKVTSTNILSILPFGCQFSFGIELRNEKPRAYIRVYHPRNNQQLSIGEEERISQISTPKEFRDFIEYYIKTCPEDYFKRIERLRNETHKTVKYKVGDLFRVEVDRFNYCYGLITGEVREIRKWGELPERHSLHAYMLVPIMIRFYDLVTPNSHLTVEDLKHIPLCKVEICGDNDIIWGTHPIIGHKELEEDDLDFYLIVSKYINENKHTNVFTHDSLMKTPLLSREKEYNLYIEWGFASTKLEHYQLPNQLKEMFDDYQCPHGGISMGIYPSLLMIPEEKRMIYYQYRENLLEDHNSHLKETLFEYLGLEKNASFDDFALAFEGLTKHEILKKIKE